MALPLDNFKSLKDDIIKHGWCMTLFEFKYNNDTYFAEVKPYLDNTQKPNKYALVSLLFLRKSNLNDTFSTWANSSTIGFKNIQSFREYFHIKYRENMGDIVKQFIQYFGKLIPININLNSTEKMVLIQRLNISDSENPNKIYCIGLRRNPILNDIQNRRTKYNDQKAKMLRPELYKTLFLNGNDDTISFCFSTNPYDEKTDAEILHLFANKQLHST